MTTLAVAAYALFVGGDVPIARAAVMAGAVLLGRALEVDVNTGNLLGLAALVLLAASPAAAGDVGFQLSFGATLGILALTAPLTRGLPRLPLRLDLAVAASVAAQCALAPLLAGHFHRLAPAAVLLNIAAVPLSGAVLLAGLGVLAATPLRSRWPVGRARLARGPGAARLRRSRAGGSVARPARARAFVRRARALGRGAFAPAARETGERAGAARRDASRRGARAVGPRRRRTASPERGRRRPGRRRAPALAERSRDRRRRRRLARSTLRPRRAPHGPRAVASGRPAAGRDRAFPRPSRSRRRSALPASRLPGGGGLRRSGGTRGPVVAKAGRGARGGGAGLRGPRSAPRLGWSTPRGSGPGAAGASAAAGAQRGLGGARRGLRRGPPALVRRRERRRRGCASPAVVDGREGAASRQPHEQPAAARGGRSAPGSRSSRAGRETPSAIRTPTFSSAGDRRGRWCSAPTGTGRSSSRRTAAASGSADPRRGRNGASADRRGTCAKIPGLRTGAGPAETRPATADEPEREVLHRQRPETLHPRGPSARRRLRGPGRGAGGRGRARAAAPGPGQESEGPADFSHFLLGLAAQAGQLIAGQELPEGTTPEQALSGARSIIAILEMLKDKTEGRRTAEEDALVAELLFELRMAYVERTRAGKS